MDFYDCTLAKLRLTRPEVIMRVKVTLTSRPHWRTRTNTIRSFNPSSEAAKALADLSSLQRLRRNMMPVRGERAIDPHMHNYSGSSTTANNSADGIRLMNR